MSKVNKKNDQKNRESIGIWVAIIGIFVASFVGGLTVASGLNWGSRASEIKSLNKDNQKIESEYNELKQEYDELKQEYDELKQEYDLVLKEQYISEYTVREGETIVDQTIGCSLYIKRVYSHSESVNIELYNTNESESSVNDIDLYKAVPYDILGDDHFFLILKKINGNMCTITIIEKKS